MTSFLNSIGKKKSSIEQLILSTKLTIQTLITNNKNINDDNNNESMLEEKLKNMEQIHIFLLDIKNILTNNHHHNNSNHHHNSNNNHNNHEDDEKVYNLSKYIQNEQLFDIIIENINLLSTESKKDCTIIFNYLIRKNINNFQLYILKSFKIIDLLIINYIKSECIISCGIMLREIIRIEDLVKVILYILL